MTFKKAAFFFTHKVKSECITKSLNRKLKLALLLFLFFYTVKVLAVQNGQIFWEVRKPGVESNYILGLHHTLFLDDKSLPPEITAAINNSQTGLIEINREELKRLVEAIKTTALFLPEGETLSLYLGEEKAREVFKFLQLEHDSEKSLANKLNILYGIDITSYETVNRLIPIWLVQLPKLANYQENLNEHFSKYPIPDCPSKDAKPMDSFIENAIICKGKPVHSIETAETQVTPYFERNHHADAQTLYAYFKKNFQYEQGHLSEMDITIDEWNSLSIRIAKNLMEGIENHFYHNSAIDISPITDQIFLFLRRNQCLDLPTNRVEEYMAFSLQLYQLTVHQIHEAQTEEELKQNMLPIVENLRTAETDILSSCFPDYTPEISKEEAVESTINNLWFQIKHLREKIIDERDKKQALFLLPYLEEGGVFAAVGARHLKGVLKELETKGWQIRALPLSHPIKEAQSEDNDEINKASDN